MIEENEVVMLLLGLGGLWFTILNKKQLMRIHEWKWLLASFYIILCGWMATILEGWFWPNFLNYFEHISYAASAILLFVWSWKLILSSNKSCQ